MADDQPDVEVLRKIDPSIQAVLTGSFRHGGAGWVGVCAVGDNQRVFAKLNFAATGECAGTFESLVEYGDVLGGEPQVYVPKALAWSNEPCGIVMQYVRGDPLADVVNDCVRRGASAEIDQLERLVAAAATALARLHQSLHRAIEDVRPGLDAAYSLYRLGMPPRGDSLVRHIPDFATYNLLVDDVDHVCVIDPDARKALTDWQSDVGYFLMPLMNSAVGLMPLMNSAVGTSGLARRRRGVRVYARLAETFVSSYRDESGREIDEMERRQIAYCAGQLAFQWGIRRLRTTKGLRLVGLNAIWWSLTTRVRRAERPWLAPPPA